MKISPLGAKLLRADAQRDIMKLTVAFHNVVKAAKDQCFYCQ